MCRRGGKRNGRDFLKVNKKQKINIFDLAETVARKMAENGIREGMWELRAIVEKKPPGNEWQHSRDIQMLSASLHLSLQSFKGSFQ